ncbi:MAG TPA: DUF1801 domain-containing protein [Patescibacteria group bacterium]
MHTDIATYNHKLSGEPKEICEMLAQHIDANLEGAESKVWHGAPVWFLEENPVAGYAVLKDAVQLLFWSGQSFDEDGLEAEGAFKAAQKRYTSKDEINTTDLKRWLHKAADIQWDYKNIVKRKGELIRLK